MYTTWVHPPSIPAAAVTLVRPRPVQLPISRIIRPPFNTLPVIRLAFTDQLRFIGRQRVSSGYLATGLSRR